MGEWAQEAVPASAAMKAADLSLKSIGFIFLSPFLALEGQHFGEVTALWTLKSELLAPFQLARRVKCHPRKPWKRRKQLARAFERILESDLSEKTSKMRR